MFILNFNKEWQMHKSLLIAFLITCFSILSVILIAYLLINNGLLEGTVLIIVRQIWILVVALATIFSSVLPIILMYFVLKSDLGKNNIHYTLFTPQSLFSWYLPKLVYVFLIQGFFSIITIVYSNLLISSVPEQGIDFDWLTNTISFFTETFSIGMFSLITLCTALYYSFRNKKLSWVLIVVAIFSYMTLGSIYGIVLIVTRQEIDINLNLIIPYVIDLVIGLMYITLSFFLFEKKVEY